MKRIIVPSLFVIAVVALLLWGGTASQKNKNSNTNSNNSSQSSASYYDENAKVMFFYSDLCSWCNKEKEVLGELAKDGYKVKPMDVKAHPDYWQTYAIEGTPTLIAPDGQKAIGFQDKDKLKAFLDKYK